MINFNCHYYIGLFGLIPNLPTGGEEEEEETDEKPRTKWNIYIWKSLHLHNTWKKNRQFFFPSVTVASVSSELALSRHEAHKLFVIR